MPKTISKRNQTAYTDEFREQIAKLVISGKSVAHIGSVHTNKNASLWLIFPPLRRCVILACLWARGVKRA